MGAAQQIERIARIRQLEEDESRRILELAIGELAQLELALRAAHQRERAGRSLVAQSAVSGEIADRIAGMEESRSASRLAATLAVRIRAAEGAVANLRADYLNKRTSRLQAETLARNERAREAQTNLRRAQQALDDWHLNRKRRSDARKP
ncbi:MAG: hypothetical protein ABR928_14305 [Terracidiphilus sp.]|jgi:hypothetical protein